ncbi:hypothetical protein SAMN05661096_00611 [Marivirga sericea]|uniref:Uncharacterized protein n=1 Tax=Marivirga sericea TaxID=1028 RepID=A0A1X7IG05_9BACT|nr:hypothetical protein [Marivirga sericea]SMG13648.1 hypothetical protein SAMN05661096_00611 [Marivirga sericea]
MKNPFSKEIENKYKTELKKYSTNELLRELIKREEFPTNRKTPEDAVKINIIKACWKQLSPEDLYYALDKI